MEWIDPAVRKWCQEQRQEVIKTGSRAHNCFYKRSSVSAWRMATLLYHLWGETEEARPKVIKCYRFLAQYILEGLLTQWGRQYDQLHRTDLDEEAPKQSLYDQMPHEFSRDQLNEFCFKQGLCAGRSFLSKWKRAKLIHQPDPKQDIYVKNY